VKGLLLYFKKRIPHIMISVLDCSAVDRDLDHRSGKNWSLLLMCQSCNIKDYEQILINSEST
jgi:hypothetical protein